MAELFDLELKQQLHPENTAVPLRGIRASFASVNKWVVFDRALLSQADFDLWQKAINAMLVLAATERRHRQLTHFMPQCVFLMDEKRRNAWRKALAVKYLISLFEEYYRHQSKAGEKSAASSVAAAFESHLMLLTMADMDDAQKFEAMPARKNGQNAWSPTRYLGIVLAQEHAAQLEALFLKAQRAGKKLTTEVMWQSKYWLRIVGASSILQSINTMLPNTMHRDISVKLDKPVGWMSQVGAIFFTFRLFLEISQLAKLYFKDGQETKQDTQTAPTVQFKTQWEQRKFIIMNDFMWAAVSLANLYWLSSKISTNLGLAGAAVNMVAIVASQLIMYVNHQREKTEFNAVKLSLNEQILAANFKLKSCKEGTTEAKNLYLKIENLGLALKKHEVAWSYKARKNKLSLIMASTNVLASLLLAAPLLASVGLIAPYIPILVLVGGLLSSGAMVVKSSDEKTQQGKQHQAKIKYIDIKLESIQDKFDSRKVQTPVDLEELRQLHLEYKRLGAERDFHQAMKTYVRQTHVISVIAQLTIPIIVFGATFLPLAPAIALVGCVLIASLVCQAIIKSMKPSELALEKISLSDLEQKDPERQPLTFIKVEENLEATKVEDTLIQSASKPA